MPDMAKLKRLGCTLQSLSHRVAIPILDQGDRSATIAAFPDARERTRGRKWMAIRHAAMTRDLHCCVHCMRDGIARPAKVVDHILPLLQGGTDDLDNLQSLCHSHHDIKTTEEAGHRANTMRSDRYKRP